MRKSATSSRGVPPLLLGLGAVLLAGVGLWAWLAADGGRGGRAPRAAPAPAADGSVAAELAQDLARPGPAEEVASGARAPERSALAHAAEPPAAAAEGFDPAAITGRVVFAGVPVPGVELQLFTGTFDRRERVSPAATAESDADGRFRFPGLEPQVRHSVRAQHPEYLPEEATFFPGRDDDLELEPAVRVAGTVRSARTRAPLAGVEVALERWHYGADGVSARVHDVSDAEGRWQLPWAEPGMERFLVTRPGFTPERHDFQVGPDGGTEFDILLDERPGLELELYVHETGALLADAEVVCDDAVVRTDARGHLTVPIVPGATPDDQLRVALALPEGCLTLGRVSPAAVRGFLRLPLVQGSVVHGRVLDEDGAAVAGALVRMGGGRSSSAIEMPEGFWIVPSRASARSAVDGTFRLTGMPPRTTPVELAASHPRHPPGRSEPFELPRAGMDVAVDVVLERGGTIRGVLRLDGVPAPLELFWEGERASGWVGANDRGEYRIDGIPAGDVDLRPRVEDEDEDEPRAEDARVTIAPGQTLELDFDLLSRRARIRGRVLDAAGDPVARAEVVAIPADEDAWQGEEPRAESRPDGTFELLVPDVPGLLFDVEAERGPRRAVAEDVRAGAEVQLVLPVLAPLALRVIDALAREPVQGFQVFWRESEGGRWARLVQGGGRFSPGPDGRFVAELPLGELDLAVSARSQGYVTAVQRGIRLTGNGVPEVEFELYPGVALELELEVAPEAADFKRMLQRGRIALASEEQWAERGRGGSLFQQEVRTAQSVRLEANGEARMTGLAPGTYRLINVPREYDVRPQRLEIPPVANHRVKLTVGLQPQKGKPGQRRD